MTGFSATAFIISAALLGLGCAAGCSADPAKPADLPASATAPAAVQSNESSSPKQAGSAPAPNSDGVPVELSEEDRRLIAADPSTLSPEDRRKRAFAMRRKIMQNPDSDAARTLEDLRKAHEAGQLSGTKPNELRLQSTANVRPGAATPAGDPKQAAGTKTVDEKATNVP